VFAIVAHERRLKAGDELARRVRELEIAIASLAKESKT